MSLSVRKLIQSNDFVKIIIAIKNNFYRVLFLRQKQGHNFTKVKWDIMISDHIFPATTIFI